MSTNVRCGRHRADHAPNTPLTALSKTAADAARKGALVAATSGIIATTLSSTASATPAGNGHHERVTGLDLEALKAARTTTDTAPAVRVAPDARLDFTATVVRVKPAPEPEPEPAPAPAPEPAAGPATAPAGTAAPASDGSIGARAVAIAMQFVGTPYVWGGESPGGFDCSGLVKYAFAQVGVSLPHSSTALRGSGTVVSAAAARPGDLVWTPGHIAIYAGNGMVVEAVSQGTPLSYRAMWQSNPTYVRVV
ncbi:C40 family peptidase [Myceligenerans xiligouense]|uniref:Cell wall-associated NlpC family hydrolase n=1 Tax=Myceligenerans xiligouense TaxID=253184 RepID=A0A3N4ZBT5_9MICO|nr:C40 family peptidase [Myceligenerans xiligouense]RPF23348.1 cell wall-associated NlpC family hydrolase [Myceligenerans xiligouense]